MNCINCSQQYPRPVLIKVYSLTHRHKYIHTHTCTTRTHYGVFLSQITVWKKVACENTSVLECRYVITALHHFLIKPCVSREVLILLSELLCFLYRIISVRN